MRAAHRYFSVRRERVTLSDHVIGLYSLKLWDFKHPLPPPPQGGGNGAIQTSILIRHVSILPSDFQLEGCMSLNPLTPNDPSRGRTAPLTSKRCILYIYSTNIGTEDFKHGIYSPFFPLQNTVCFIILTYLVPVLFTFCIQGVLKLNKIIPAPKG